MKRTMCTKIQSIFGYETRSHATHNIFSSVDTKRPTLPFFLMAMFTYITAKIKYSRSKHIIIITIL